VILLAAGRGGVGRERERKEQTEIEPPEVAAEPESLWDGDEEIVAEIQL
jgi:hypothetical protein